MKYITLSLLLLMVGSASFAKAEKSKPKSICQKDAIERSKCMIEFLLMDISKEYKGSHFAGGISSIRLLSTDTYRVELPQEERLDLLTYHLGLSPKGAVILIKRESGTEAKTPPK